MEDVGDTEFPGGVACGLGGHWGGGMELELVFGGFFACLQVRWISYYMNFRLVSNSRACGGQS